MGLPFNPEYGLIAVFCVVLVQQLGAPLPVLPVMLFAGAQSARDPVFGVYALALAIVASTVGSMPWFWAGQRCGHRVLKLTCRVSLSPDGCVRQTETAFERHGASAVLISKFVPGVAHRGGGAPGDDRPRRRADRSRRALGHAPQARRADDSRRAGARPRRSRAAARADLRRPRRHRVLRVPE